jgi:uncharacterized iron-regulated membrane protein
MRRTLLQIHLYIGLAACLFLAVLSLTGAVITFENELNQAVNPWLLTVQPEASALPWETVRHRVEEQEPAWRVQRIYMPANSGDSTYVRLVSRTSPRTGEVYVNQYTGTILGWKQKSNQLLWKIHEVHINLAAGTVGSQFVTWSSIALLCLSLSGLYLWWPRKIFRFTWRRPLSRTNYDLHRTLGFWSSGAMFLFAVTGLNLHIQTGGTLFEMMDAKASPVNHPGHGTSADQLLQTAREAVPGAQAMRISFWDDKRPVLVQMRFPEDHTPAGRTSVTLDPRTGAVLKVVSSRTAPLVYTALVQWNREIHTGTMFGWPSRILASCLSVLLSVLAISGTMIFINVKLGRRRRAFPRTGRVAQPMAEMLSSPSHPK